MGVSQGGSSTFIECTITSNRMKTFGGTTHRASGVFVGSNSTATFVRTIISGNCPTDDLGVGEESHVVLECCVVGSIWTLDGGLVEYIGESVFEDPLFCVSQPECWMGAVDPIDYRIDVTSPCFPANRPCGALIGALGVGCPAAYVRDGDEHATTFGQVRLTGPISNPVHDEARFSIQVLGAPVEVRASVVAANGRLVQTLVDGEIEVGRHELRWRPFAGGGVRLSSGVYFICVDTRVGRESRMFVVVR